MNPTTIPDDEIWPGSTRFIAIPPGGDMTGEGGISPCEMLRGGLEDTNIPFHAMRFVASPSDIERLQAGEPLWLVYFTPTPVPVALEFLSDIVEQSDERGEQGAI